jgi:hypothetical protein
MSRTFDWLGGFLMGAAVMSLADPLSGPSRRVFLRGKAIRTLHRTSDFLERAIHDLRNRTCGAIAEARARRRNDQPEDPVLIERVRARLGRSTVHPHAIEVDANRGRVTLRGIVPAGEAMAALAATGDVLGVTSVLDRLERLDSDEIVPGATEASDRIAPRTFARWSPGMQLLAGVGGALVLTTGVILLARTRRAPVKQPDYASLIA